MYDLPALFTWASWRQLPLFLPVSLHPPSISRPHDPNSNFPLPTCPQSAQTSDAPPPFRPRQPEPPVSSCSLPSGHPTSLSHDKQSRAKHAAARPPQRQTTPRLDHEEKNTGWLSIRVVQLFNVSISTRDHLRRPRLPVRLVDPAPLSALLAFLEGRLSRVISESACSSAAYWSAHGSGHSILRECQDCR